MTAADQITPFCAPSPTNATYSWPRQIGGLACSPFVCAVALGGSAAGWWPGPQGDGL